MADRSIARSSAIETPTAYPARWLALLVLLAGALMDLIDSTIVNVALPTIRRDMAASDTSLEWIASGYLLAFAVTLITAGRLGDRLGHKRLFMLGVLVFGVSSFACGISQDPTELVGARIVEGVAAGVMVPQVLATARSIFGGKERASVFAIYGAIAGLAVAVGLVLGGVLTDANLFGMAWRSVFFVNVPVAIIVLVAGMPLIPETRDASAPRPDLTGTALLSVGLIAVVYALLEGRTLGWPTWLWAVLAAGVGALALLAVVESRRSKTSEALMLTTLFRAPAFAAGILIQLIFSAAMAGFFFVLTIWLQGGEGFSPLTAGLTAVAFSLGTILFATAPEKLAPRFGRWILVVGGVLMAVGIAVSDLVAHAGPTPINGWVLAPGLLVAGVGLALLIIPMANVVMSVIPAAAGGSASGVLSTAQQLGGAIGIGIVGEIFFGALATASLRSAFETSAPVVAVGFAICALLAFGLPRQVVGETYSGEAL
jgi:EmrB/QacA subfamily drug resistance transporter